jgi:hypothetical protein
MKQRFCRTAAIVSLSVTAIGGAFAAGAADNDALGIDDAKISLIQAVTAAEQHVGGKASRAEYERHQNQGVFDVEVVNGTHVTDVRVDPSSGKVLSAAADEADRQDQGDRSEHEDDRD